MKSWDYLNDVPFIPVKIHGPKLSVGILALVDTGAKYCVAHEKLVKEIGLATTGHERMSGFGSSRKFKTDLCQAKVEIENTKHDVLIAAIQASYYPLVAPKFVLGRNLLNKFKITLDGRNRKIHIE